MASDMGPKGEARRTRVQVIFNPIAGWRRRSRFRSVVETLREFGIDVTVMETSRVGDARAFAAAARNADTEALTVAGGDGTINEAINGLNGDAPPLAVIPLGTANVLAHELALPTDLGGLARAILAGPTQRIWPGTANGRRFVMMAGVGFDAHVVARVNPGLKRLTGKGAYIWQTVREMRRFPFPGYRVHIDGQSFTAASVVVAKGRAYGGPYRLGRDVRLADPMLEVCTLDRGTPLAVLDYGLALLRDRLSLREDIRHFAATRVRIEGPEGDPVQGDGDIIARLPVEIGVAEKPVTIIAAA